MPKERTDASASGDRGTSRVMTDWCGIDIDVRLSLERTRKSPVRDSLTCVKLNRSPDTYLVRMVRRE